MSDLYKIVRNETQADNQVDNHDEDIVYRSDLIRKRKKKTFRQKHKKLVLSLHITLGILAAIILSILLLWFIGMLSLKTTSSGDLDNVINYNGHTYVYNENIISTLLIGCDQTEEDEANGKAGQSDFIFLICLDLENNVVKAISISRDTMVDVAQYANYYQFGDEEKQQIALTFAYGENKEQSSENTLSAVSRLLYNIPIDRYVTMKTDAIGPITNSIGGVKLKSLETIPYTKIEKSKTANLLGDNAVKYVKWRAGDLYASNRRRERQVQFMKEFYTKAFSYLHKNVNASIAIYNSSSPLTYSNYQLSDFIYIVSNTFVRNIKDMQVSSIDGEIKAGEKFVEFWPDQTSLFETVLDTFYNCID